MPEQSSLNKENQWVMGLFNSKRNKMLKKHLKIYKIKFLMVIKSL